VASTELDDAGVIRITNGNLMRLPVSVFTLDREKYYDLNLRHFHEKLREEPQIALGHTWVKKALHGAGLVRRVQKHGVHRRRRERPR
jgi:hypothetical protein